MNFKSNYKEIKLLEKYIKFKQQYSVRPVVFCFAERLKGKKKIPHFLIGNINHDGFYFHYEKYNKNEIKFYFEVREEVLKIREKITLGLTK